MWTLISLAIAAPVHLTYEGTVNSGTIEVDGVPIDVSSQNYTLGLMLESTVVGDGDGSLSYTGLPTPMTLSIDNVPRTLVLDDSEVGRLFIDGIFLDVNFGTGLVTSDQTPMGQIDLTDTTLVPFGPVDVVAAPGFPSSIFSGTTFEFGAASVLDEVQLNPTSVSAEDATCSEGAWHVIANQAFGEGVITEDSSSARLRPSVLLAELAEAEDLLGTCASGGVQSCVGGRFGKRRLTGLDSLGPFSGTRAGGGFSMVTSDGIDVSGDIDPSTRHAVGTDADDGFVALTYKRVKGKRGIFLGVNGTCPNAESVVTGFFTAP